MPKTDIIRIQKITLGGRVYIDIRRCLETPSGGKIPTSRGVSIPLDKIDEVLEKAFSANGVEEYIEL